MTLRADTPVLHAAFDARAWPSDKVFATVQYPHGVGGFQDVKLYGLKADFWELAAALASGFRAATAAGPGDWIVEVLLDGAGGLRVRRADGAPFSCTFSKALQDHVALPALASGAPVVDSTDQPTAAYWPTAGIADPDVRYRYRRRWAARYRGRPPVCGVIDVQRMFTGRLTWQYGVDDAEDDVHQLEVLLELVLRGVPFRLFLDPKITSPWSETNRAGYLDLMLDADTFRRQAADSEGAMDGVWEILGVVL